MLLAASQGSPLPDAPPEPCWGRAALGSPGGFVGSGSSWLWRRELGVNQAVLDRTGVAPVAGDTFLTIPFLPEGEGGETGELLGNYTSTRSAEPPTESAESATETRKAVWVHAPRSFDPYGDTFVPGESGRPETPECCPKALPRRGAWLPGGRRLQGLGSLPCLAQGLGPASRSVARGCGAPLGCCRRLLRGALPAACQGTLWERLLQTR